MMIMSTMMATTTTKTILRIPPAQTQRAKSPSTSRTIHYLSCTPRCRRNGNTVSPPRRPSPRIRSRGTVASTSPTAGTGSRCIRGTRRSAGAVCRRCCGASSASGRREAGTCGCAMRVMRQGGRDVLFSSGLSSMTMGSPYGGQRGMDSNRNIVLKSQKAMRYGILFWSLRGSHYYGNTGMDHESTAHKHISSTFFVLVLIHCMYVQ